MKFFNTHLGGIGGGGGGGDGGGGGKGGGGKGGGGLGGWASSNVFTHTRLSL